MRLQGTADFRQQFRANQVSVRVVDFLKVVEIDEHQGELVVVSLRAINLRLQDESHVPCVIQSDGGKGRQRFQQVQISRIKPLGSKAIDELDHTEAGILKHHWDGDDGLGFHLGLLVDLAEKSRIL